MNIYFKYITAGITAAVAGITPAAAQGLSKEITINKDVVPQERAASRLPVLPDVLEVKPANAELQFSYTGISARLAPYASWLAPSAVGKAVSISDWRGYIEAGYFPAYNATLSAGYRALDNTTDRLNIWTHFSGSSWRNPDSDIDKSLRPKFNDSGIALGASYLHRFSDISSLDMALTIGGDWFNNPFEGADVSQGVLGGKLDARWISRGGSVDYNVALHGNIFKMQKVWDMWKNASGIKPAGEQTVTIDGGMSVPFSVKTGTSALSFDYAATILHRNSSMRAIYSDGNYFAQNGRVSGLVSLTPGMRFGGNNYQFNIGARVDFSFNSGGGTFHIAPKIEAVGATSRYFRLFATATGGQVTNSISDIYGDLRYVNPSLSFAFSQIAVDAEAGFIVGPWRGVQLKMRGGYSVANDWMMPGGGTGTLHAVDMKGWRIGADLRYDWRDIVGVEGKVTLAPHDYDKGYYMWRDRASLQLAGQITVRPISALSINISGDARLKRRYYPGALSGYVPLGSAADLSVGADYRFTPQLSVFAKGNNLLNHSWSEAIGPGIPCHGLTGLVGVTYLF